MAKQQDEDLDTLLDEADNDDEELFSLADVQEAHIGAHPAGRYLCAVSDCKLVKIKSGPNTGQKQFAIRFKPVFPASNKLIFKNAQLTGKGAPYAKGLLKTLGVDVNEPIGPSKIVADEDGNDRLIWLNISVRKDKPSDNEIDSYEAFDPDNDPRDDADEDALN